MPGSTEPDSFCKQIFENLNIFQKEIYETEDENSSPDQCVGVLAWIQNSVLRELALVCEPKNESAVVFPHGGLAYDSSSHDWIESFSTYDALLNNLSGDCLNAFADVYSEWIYFHIFHK